MKRFLLVFKRVIRLFLFSFLLATISLATLSFATPDAILNIYPQMISTVYEQKTPASLVLKKKETRIDNIIDSSILNVLVRGYYSYYVGSKFLTDNIVLKVTNKELNTKEYKLSLLETEPRPMDNINFVSHGNLEPLIYKMGKYENYNSPYYQLMDENTMYIPDYLLSLINKDFSVDISSVDDFDDYVFSVGYSKMEKELVEELIEVKICGVYKTDSDFGKDLKSVNDNYSETNLSICSRGLLANLPYSESSLLMFLRYIKDMIKETYYSSGFFSLIQIVDETLDGELSFLDNGNIVMKNSMDNILQRYNGYKNQKFNFLIIIAYCAVIIFGFVSIFVLKRKKKLKSFVPEELPVLIFVEAAATILSVIILRFISKFTVNWRMVLSRSSLFITLPLLLVFMIILNYLLKDRNKESIENYRFKNYRRNYSIKI